VCAMSPAACPRCGQFDMVQRVVGIVASQSSPLSWELRAPPPPGAVARARGRSGFPWGCLAVAVLVTLPLDVLIVLGVLLAAAALAIVAAVALAVAGAGYGLYRYLSRHVIAERRAWEQQQRAEEWRRYQHALTYWNQVCHCYRCHGVFLPENEWQYRAITVRGALVPPTYAWAFSQQLADYVDRVHAPEVVRLDGPQPEG
jgi:hypothetical protein